MCCLVYQLLSCQERLLLPFAEVPFVAGVGLRSAFEFYAVWADRVNSILALCMEKVLSRFQQCAIKLQGKKTKAGSSCHAVRMRSS